jgi:hypothetical protein
LIRLDGGDVGRQGGDELFQLIEGGVAHLWRCKSEAFGGADGAAAAERMESVGLVGRGGGAESGEGAAALNRGKGRRCGIRGRVRRRRWEPAAAQGWGEAGSGRVGGRRRYRGAAAAWT